jgi:hypothetical protein
MAKKEAKREVQSVYRIVDVVVKVPLLGKMPVVVPLKQRPHPSVICGWPKW